MKSKLLSILCVASFAVVPSAQAATLDDVKSALNSQPYETSVDNNDEIFAKYCTGEADSTEIPQPNYSNALVKKAAQILAKTKADADAILKANAATQFQGFQADLVKELTTLSQTTTNKNIADAAKELAAKVSGDGVTSIPATAKDDVAAMNAEIILSLTGLAADLSKGLSKDLQGIDAKNLQKIGQTLQTQFEKEFTAVNYKNLKAAVAGIQKIITPNAPKYDFGALKTAAQAVVDYANANPTDENISSAKDEAAALLTAIAANSPDTNQNITYQISDLVYYTSTDAEPNAQTLVAAHATFQAESNKSQTMNLLNSLATVLDLTEKQDAQSLNYQVDGLATDLTTALEDANQKYLFGTDKQITQAKAFIVQISREGMNFKAGEILDNVKKMNAGFTEAGDADAIAVATGDLQYPISQLDVKALSKPTADAIAAFQKEMAKSNSESVKTNAAALVTQLAAAKGVMTDDLTSAIQSVVYDMQSPITASPGTLQLVAAFNTIAADFNSVSKISSSYVTPLLNVSESGHFYFYGGVRKMYGLSAKIPTEATQAGANKEAHWFLVQLCGEFRDRATMIEAKLNWIQNLYTLPKSDVPVVEPETLAQAPNVWARINASAYAPYLEFSRTYWEARREAQARYITIGDRQDVDNPVNGVTVCQTKYIFAGYVAAGKAFDSVEEFNQGYEAFKKGCPKEDLTDYYDFRGDSNFKQYSPESNGMIWYATTMASACKSATEARDKSVTSEDCKNYFSHPFYYRYNAARAGLAAWLFRNDQYANDFNDPDKMIAIYPHTQPDLAPYSFGFDHTSRTDALFDYDANWLAIPGAWNSSDIGFNAFTGLGTENPNYSLAYERIRAAVDRHTDWYHSGYNDGVTGSKPKDQAYSPFVASSYEMSASDGFVQCGTTVGCPDDGLKRWMFVFRIKAQNWYNPQRVLNNEKVDFDKMWFDETSFGVSGLADGEHAWDRLGTAMESEVDSILYLINVNNGGGGTEPEGD